MNDFQYNALLIKAQQCIQNKQIGEASSICEKLRMARRNEPIVHALMAKISVEQTHDDEAIKYLERAIALAPKTIDFHLDLGWQLSRLGRYPQAIARLEKARKLQPDNASVISGLANALERSGEKDKARQLLEPLVSKQREDGHMAVVWARLALDLKNPDEAVRVLERHIHSPPRVSSYFFVLGEAHEKAGNLEKAFHAYCAANQKPTHGFSLDDFIERYRQLIDSFTRTRLQSLPKPVHDTSLPIFIAGRPRSGTTLVEKILDAHPSVTGIGEFPHLPRIIENMGFEIGSSLMYPRCISDLDQHDVNRLSLTYLDAARTVADRARHVADKNLGNFEMLGSVQILFPQSHVVHVRRDPIDNCWAIFVADMTYGWTADLRTLGIVHSLYERLMQHWADVLDLAMLHIDYEAIVDDLEGSTRRMLEFCGLEWDERCLRYYESESKRKEAVSAPTLSYNQVRQPIYKTSVNRAAKFEPYLGPLREGLEEGRRIAASLGVQQSG